MRGPSLKVMKKDKKLVIVESPAKARTISRFLDSGYVVDFCLGHIRDLPASSKDLPSSAKGKAWARFGVDIENNFTPFYLIPEDKKKVVQNLKNKLKISKELILATDEDREGESISWHLKEILKPKVPLKRMVFHEITKKAIEKALKDFRGINSHLVQAQEARRILDRLVGYSLSPILWKKVMRGLSAGRVQSVAVSMVSERELKRLAFKKQTYWSVSAFHPIQKKNSSSKTHFQSRLLSFEGKTLVSSQHFDSMTGQLKPAKNLLFLKEKQALKLIKDMKGGTFKTIEVSKKQIARKPPPPFITSTLQQECSRRLHLSSSQTMRQAQSLYEQGWITYMRTDSQFLSSEAIRCARKIIKDLYGKSYLPDSPRVFKGKIKGAQEAHEAIRPAGENFVPPEKTKLSGLSLSVYELIWKRTLASQMKDCLQDQVRLTLQNKKALFVSSGMSIKMPGFYILYPDQEREEVLLPVLKKGDPVPCEDLKPLKHETKAPARFTEASLIQKLEKEGVGRPSTYAAIISTIQERGYVKKESNALIPTFTALVVSKLLKRQFPDYVDTQFTSEMEKDLDDIAKGKKKIHSYLKSVYFGKKGLKQQINSSEKNTLDKKDLSFQFQGLEGYSFHVGPFGAYVSTQRENKEISASLPHDMYPGDVDKKQIEDLIANKLKKDRILGKDPGTGQNIYLLSGRYGAYLQRGGDPKKPSSPKGKKNSSQKDVKRTGIKPFFTEDTITLKEALKLLELPKLLGLHPETRKEVKKGLGRFGPYVVCDREFRSVPADQFFHIDLKAAVERLKQARGKRRGQKKTFKHPASGAVIELMKGRYGSYLRYRGKNYSLPSDLSDTISEEQAVEVLKSASKKTKAFGAKKPVARKKLSNKTTKKTGPGGQRGKKSKT